MRILPSLQTGLDINIRFDSVLGFDWDDTVNVFDVFGINVCHGWTCDPQDAITYSVVVGICGTYNKLAEFAVLDSGKDEDRTRQALICQEFLGNTASQLTYHGLQSLMETIPPDSLAVFFRNNHFLTLFKRGDRELYTLVTDQGYAGQETIVWETLNNVEGDSAFVDSHFKRRSPIAFNDRIMTAENLTNEDRE